MSRRFQIYLVSTHIGIRSVLRGIVVAVQLDDSIHRPGVLHDLRDSGCFVDAVASLLDGDRHIAVLDFLGFEQVLKDVFDFGLCLHL